MSPAPLRAMRARVMQTIAMLLLAIGIVSVSAFPLSAASLASASESASSATVTAADAIEPTTPFPTVSLFDTAAAMLAAANSHALSAPNAACATITDCDACYNTTGCHFCENDNQCHAVGSVYGCLYGLTCPTEDPCVRATPTFRSYGSAPGYVYPLMIFLAAAIFAIVISLLYCIFFKCSSSPTDLPGDSESDAVSASAATAGSGGAGDQYYRLSEPSRPRGSSAAAADRPAVGSSEDRLGERWLESPPPVSAAAARSVLGMRPAAAAAAPAPAAPAMPAAGLTEAEFQALPQYMRARVQMQVHDDALAAGSLNGDGDLSPRSGRPRRRGPGASDANALDCCYQTCCCLCLCDHRGGGVRGACRTLGRWLHGVVTCKPKDVFALFVVVVGVTVSIAAIIGMVFWPQYPAYSLCNKSIHWGSILSSLTEFQVAVNATFHFALHNPNRFDVAVNHLTCYVKYKGDHVAVASVAGDGSTAKKLAQTASSRVAYMPLALSAADADVPLGLTVGSYSGVSYDAVASDNHGVSASSSTSDSDTFFAPWRAALVSALSNALTAGSAAKLTVSDLMPSALTADGDGTTRLPAGSVADVKIVAKIDPESAVAAAMAIDYAMGSLFLDVELFIDTSVALWDKELGRVNTSFVWEKMDVNGPPERHLCKCG